MATSVLRAGQDHLATLYATGRDWVVTLYYRRQRYQVVLPIVMFGRQVELLGLTDRDVVLSYTTDLGTRYVQVNVVTDDVVADVNPDRGQILVADRWSRHVAHVTVRSGQLLVSIGNQLINLGGWFILPTSNEVVDPVRRCPVTVFRLRVLGLGYFSVSLEQSTVVFRLAGADVRAVYFDTGAVVDCSVANSVANSVDDCLLIRQDGQTLVYVVGRGTVAVLDRVLVVRRGWLIEQPARRLLMLQFDDEQVLGISLDDCSTWVVNGEFANWNKWL